MFMLCFIVSSVLLSHRIDEWMNDGSYIPMYRRKVGTTYFVRTSGGSHVI